MFIILCCPAVYRQGLAGAFVSFGVRTRDTRDASIVVLALMCTAEGSGEEKRKQYFEPHPHKV